MRPLSLHLENVRTFDTLTFDFPEGACAVVGPNGAGKSSLISALDAALFGAEGRSLADWLSKDRPEQTMVIALTFEHAGDTLRIRRTFDGRGRGKSGVDFEHETDGSWFPLTRESASATQELIEAMIGLDRTSFRASAFMAQGDGGAFCEATPGRRKEILASVLGLGVWDGYRDRARAELRAAEQSLAVVRAKIETAGDLWAQRAELETQHAEAGNRERDARLALQECGSQLAKARERLSALREAAGLREAAKRARDAAERAHASLLDRIAGLEQQIREAEGRLAEREGLEVLAEGLPGLERERDARAEQAQGYAERQRLEAERTRLLEQASTLEREADAWREKAVLTLDRIGSEHCDTCGQILGEEAARAASSNYAAKAAKLTTDCGKAKDEALGVGHALLALPLLPPDADRTRQVDDLIRLGQGAKEKLAALNEVHTVAQKTRVDLSALRMELPEGKARADKTSDDLTALGQPDPDALRADEHLIEGAERDERGFRATLDQTLAQIARLDERLERLERLDVETQGAKNEEASLQNEVELLSHLSRACGPNGVPALILETSAIPQLEAEWNRVLRLLPTESGDIFEVELHTQRERKTGDGAVDALDVVVYANGHARPYSSYSGGERARIDIAQRRALSALLAHRKGAECPLMILDEPNSLDDQGMAALAQVLEDLAAAEGLTILVVSHDPALRDAFENSITIEKVDGRSRIVGATEPAPIMEVA